MPNVTDKIEQKTNDPVCWVCTWVLTQRPVDLVIEGDGYVVTGDLK